MEQIVEMLGRHEERISNLEKWQEKQNDSLQRLEEKVDNINKLLLTLLGGVCTSLILLVLQMGR